jgi:hypothetical protein
MQIRILVTLLAAIALSNALPGQREADDWYKGLSERHRAAFAVRESARTEYDKNHIENLIKRYRELGGQGHPHKNYLDGLRRMSKFFGERGKK